MADLHEIRPGAAALHVAIAELISEAFADPDGAAANDLRVIGILPPRTASDVPAISGRLLGLGLTACSGAIVGGVVALVTCFH